MQTRLVAAAVLSVMAPVAMAMNFQPGYWEITVTGANGKHTARRCLHEVKPRFTELQKRFCKRLAYKVSGNTMLSRVHCTYPQTELISYERLTFSGDTVQGQVRLEVSKPQRQTIHYSVSGRRLSATCPVGGAADTQ